MKRLALTLAALLVVAVPAALATTVGDRDDIAVGMDISKVAGAHNRASDQLVHTIDFYDAIPGTLATPGSICVEIWTRSTPGQAPADYEACATRDKNHKWRASVDRPRERGPRLRIGAVKVQQPSDTRLVLRIDPDDIKRPASYRWRVESTSFNKDCKAPAGCPDYAPDRPATATTKLSTPRR
jgi:hypothetical protein